MRISALGKLFVSDAQPASHLLYVNAAGRSYYRSINSVPVFHRSFIDLSLLASI